MATNDLGDEPDELVEFLDRWRGGPRSPWSNARWFALGIGVLLGAISMVGRVTGRQGGAVFSASFETASGAISQCGLWLLPIAFGIYAGLKEARLPKATSAPSSLAAVMSLCALAGAAPLLLEGLLCYILIVPWHLMVGPLVALITDALSRRARSKAVDRSLAIVIFSTAAYSSAPTSTPAPELLTDEVTVELPRAQVFASISHLYLPMQDASPLWMRALLPEPLAIEGGGSEVGSERRIRFLNGVLLARVTQSQAPESFTFAVSAEQAGREFFDHWLSFGDSVLRFEELGPGRTKIVHATEYTPRAQPRWYFARAERMMGHAIQQNLLDAYARSMEKAQSDVPSAVQGTFAAAP